MPKIFFSTKFSCSALALIIFAAANLNAQTDDRINALLLKKELAQVIKETENSSANDLPSLLRRLDLYYRIVDSAKIISTVRQITETVKTDEDRYRAAESVKYAINNEYFKDAATWRLYLQKINYDGTIYEKFAESCRAEPIVCGAHDFDEWLARKTSAARNESESSYYQWLERRINWREKVGFDNAEIFAGFAADVRENPGDPAAAKRYARYFRQPEEIAWLAEIFASPHAYDSYSLGKTIVGSVNYSPHNEAQKRQILYSAALLLQKSLRIPFSEKDKELINSYVFSYASMPPRIGNYEKQLRYWTKTELAEVFRRIEEPQNAQPIVEELARLDTSDIMPGNAAYLAGAVQMASGARVVESKILADQSERQNSYEYWNERISYYTGREEPERVIDAYRQALATIPFDLNDEQSRGRRVFLIRRFADFADEKFGYYANRTGEMTDEEKLKAARWKETEYFLRGEFETRKSNIDYASELFKIFRDENFTRLCDEIISRYANFLAASAKIIWLSPHKDLLYYFLQSETASQSQKTAVMNELRKIAESSNALTAWTFGEMLLNADRAGVYAARITAILLKNLNVIEKNPNLIKILAVKEGEDEDYDPANLKRKYREILFSAYLAANDWKSAEKLILNADYNPSLNYLLWRLAENAAKNAAASEVVRIWKLKASLNRRDLENLEFLAKNNIVKENLREFYRQMKISEPFSPIPDIALQKLK